MVHTWISLENNKIAHPCKNKRILRIFKNENVYFYGDYTFDIYLGTKHDYTSLDAVVSKVIENGNGWIRHNDMNKAVSSYISNLSEYISKCGDLPYNEFKKLWPRSENYEVLRGYVFRDDGNFLMYACETCRFYYVICFATS